MSRRFSRLLLFLGAFDALSRPLWLTIVFADLCFLSFTARLIPIDPSEFVPTFPRKHKDAPGTVTNPGRDTMSFKGRMLHSVWEMASRARKQDIKCESFVSLFELEIARLDGELTPESSLEFDLEQTLSRSEWRRLFSLLLRSRRLGRRRSSELSRRVELVGSR